MKRCVVLFVSFLLFAGPVFGAGASRSKAAFWDALKAELQLVVPERKAAPAFAGDQGGRAKQDLSDSLYWKGRENTIVVAEAELAAFNRALQPALEGKSNEAMAGFEEFLKQYPESVLAGHARAALAELRGDKSK